MSQRPIEPLVPGPTYVSRHQRRTAICVGLAIFCVAIASIELFVIIGLVLLVDDLVDMGD